jgi:hypothetical protein
MFFLGVCLVWIFIGAIISSGWWWTAKRNDRRQYGENYEEILTEKSGPVRRSAFWEFIFLTTILWPMALGVMINGWWTRRKNKESEDHGV